MPKPIFFPDVAAFDAWLDEHGAGDTEVQVGYHKRATGRPSLTWSESVDVALCHGWIDGVRHRIDETSYTIRFTPRRAGSVWSNVNVAKVAGLEAAGRMRAAGRAAFAVRSAERTGIYGTEQKDPRLSPEYQRRFEDHPQAWIWFQARGASYRKPAIHWVMSAKAEATRQRRLQQLISDSAAGRTVPPLTRRG